MILQSLNADVFVTIKDHVTGFSRDSRFPANRPHNSLAVEKPGNEPEKTLLTYHTLSKAFGSLPNCLIVKPVFPEPSVTFLSGRSPIVLDLFIRFSAFSPNGLQSTPINNEVSYSIEPDGDDQVVDSLSAFWRTP